MDEVERQVAERGEWGEWRGGQAKVDRGMANCPYNFFDMATGRECVDPTQIEKTQVERFILRALRETTYAPFCGPTLALPVTQGTTFSPGMTISSQRPMGMRSGYTMRTLAFHFLAVPMPACFSN